MAGFLALGTSTHALDIVQQGYSYPQGKPQLAPGSLLHRLQLHIEPESYINTPPLSVLSTTFDQLDPTDQFNTHTSQSDLLVNVPEQLPHLDTDSQTTNAVMQPVYMQFDYPDTNEVNLFNAVLDTNYDVAATVPHYTSSYQAQHIEATPAPPAEFYDDVIGYSYSVPNIPF